MTNEPFLLIPAEKNYLWGGHRLATEFNKPFGSRIVAESWECSTHPDGLSVIASGPYKGHTLKEYLQKNPSALGDKYQGLTDLPILVKFIDAHQDLSVQVHPDNEYAAIHENGQKGKQEVWCFLDAEEGASAIYGLNHDSDREEIEQLLAQSKIENALQRISVHPGDVFYIKPGTIHALGQGSLVLEVQDNSNVTYRMFDYNRFDANGKPRSLHLDKALDVLNYNHAPSPRQPIRVFRHCCGYYRETLARCESFQLDLCELKTDAEGAFFPIETNDYSFLVAVCLCGQIKFQGRDGPILLRKGQSLFVPAHCRSMKLDGVGQLALIQA